MFFTSESDKSRVLTSPANPLIALVAPSMKVLNPSRSVNFLYSATPRIVKACNSVVVGTLPAASDNAFIESITASRFVVFISTSSPESSSARSFINGTASVIHFVNSVSLGMLMYVPMPNRPAPKPTVILGTLLAASAKLPTAPIMALRLSMLIDTPSPDTSRARSFIAGRTSLINLLNLSNAFPTPPPVSESVIAYLLPAPAKINIASEIDFMLLTVEESTPEILFSPSMKGFNSSINSDNFLAILGS